LYDFYGNLEEFSAVHFDLRLIEKGIDVGLGLRSIIFHRGQQVLVAVEPPVADALDASLPVVDGNGVPDLLEELETKPVTRGATLHMNLLLSEFLEQKDLLFFTACTLREFPWHDATPAHGVLSVENVTVGPDVVESVAGNDHRQRRIASRHGGGACR
jgi:hypothetical protein